MSIKQQRGVGMDPFLTLADLGNGFFVEAKAFGLICVDVGLGFHVELTEDEGIAFIDKKRVLLSQLESSVNNRLHSNAERFSAIHESLRVLHESLE
jgi:prefoldin subunit 5